MIDTIVLWFETNQAITTLLNNNPDKIVGRRPDRRRDHEIFTYEFENVTVRSHPLRCSFQVSIPKLLYGNNIKAPTLNEINHAFELLSERFDLNFFEAHVSRLDLADTIFMSKDPVYYKDCIVSFPRLEKTTCENNGCYFSSTDRTYKFYDKYKEAVNKKKDFPVEYAIKHCLRYEISLKKINRYLKLRIINAASILEEEIFISLIDYWMDSLHRFKLIDNRIEEILAYTNLRNGDKWIMDRIKYLGSLGTYLSELRQQQNAGDLSKSQKRYAVNKAVALSNRFIVPANGISLKQELIDKVEERGAYNKIFLLQ